MCNEKYYMETGDMSSTTVHVRNEKYVMKNM